MRCATPGCNDAARHSRAAALACAIGLAGCNSAPSQAILGSYFPSWMLCALAGIGGAILARLLFVAAGLDRALPAPPLVYLALTIALAFATWVLGGSFRSF